MRLTDNEFQSEGAAKLQARSHYVLVPMQCRRHSGLLSPQGKASSHSAELPSFFPSFSLCAVFLCFHSTGFEAYSFMTNRYRIFNVRTNLDACLTHEWGEGSHTNKSAQELICLP